MNLKAAEQIGLTIPQSVLNRADRVITNESIIVKTSSAGGFFLLKAPNWTPAFAGETNNRKAWFFCGHSGGSRNPG
jgi:hypothetical protein